MPETGQPERHTLAEWRVIKGFTQQELAEASHVHVSTISSIEYRGQSPILETREDIANALGVSVEQIDWPPSSRRRRIGPRRGQPSGQSSGPRDAAPPPGDVDDAGEGESPKAAARAAA